MEELDWFDGEGSLRVIINYVTVADQQTVGTRSLSLQLVPRESTVLTPISYSTLTALKRTVAYLNFRIKRGGVNTDTHYQLKEGLTLLGGNLQSTEVWNLVAQVATINNDTLVDAPLEQLLTTLDQRRPAPSTYSQRLMIRAQLFCGFARTRSKVGLESRPLLFRSPR